MIPGSSCRNGIPGVLTNPAGPTRSRDERYGSKRRYRKNLIQITPDRAGGQKGIRMATRAKSSPPKRRARQAKKNRPERSARDKFTAEVMSLIQDLDPQELETLFGWLETRLPERSPDPIRGNRKKRS